MKNLVRFIALSAVVLLIAVSCIPYELLRGEYRDVTFYNKTPDLVDIEYQVIGSTYSAPKRIAAGRSEKMQVYTVDGKATFTAEGPYVSYKWTGETINYDGSSQFYVAQNRGLIRIINKTGVAITDVSLGTLNNYKIYIANYDIARNMVVTSADIEPGLDAAIRVMSSDIFSSVTTPYYIYFTFNNNRYRTKASLELPPIGSSRTINLKFEECMLVR